MLVRSWNVYHGNSSPPGRRTYLDEMIALATADEPDVVCLQEVPAWAIGRFTAGDVAAPPRLGPLPIPAELGRRLTAAHPGKFRSAFAGQGNAVQVGRRLRVLRRAVQILNPQPVRAAAARALALDVVARLAWAKERRVVQALRLRHDDGRTFLVANMHCTSSRDARLPAVELERAATFALAQAEEDDVVVLAGDFNLRGSNAAVLALTGGRFGFSAPAAGIDHVIVRGAPVSELRVWPPEQRMRSGVLLSDHTPVEIEIG
ncbi:MAG TPA: endonuclease/exonuclease/phosphatase family protein [Gaiellaceae bacterium]|nr:endonuclease/exonuclease/phosphatase family protein [Gaiellaceae bacterium]